jgi:hypothetical protein
MHRNVLAVALANKLARIAWRVLAGKNNYQAQPGLVVRTSKLVAATKLERRVPATLITATNDFLKR